MSATWYQENCQNLHKHFEYENKAWGSLYIDQCISSWEQRRKVKKWTCFQGGEKSFRGAPNWVKNGWKWNQNLIDLPGAQPGLEGKWEIVFESEQLYQRTLKICGLVRFPPPECASTPCVSYPPDPHSDALVGGRERLHFRDKLWLQEWICIRIWSSWASLISNLQMKPDPVCQTENIWKYQEHQPSSVVLKVWPQDQQLRQYLGIC